MKKLTILIVDDELNILNSLKRLLRKENYNILTANSGKEGLEALKQHSIALVISDQRMPEMTGIEFLRQVKELYPDTVRVILSGYTEVNTIVSAINEGEVYKFMTKPWNDEEIKISIKRALEQYELFQENRELYKKVKEQNEKLVDLVQNLEKKVEERTHDLRVQNKALQISQTIVENFPMGIGGIDEKGNIVLGNRKIHEDFGIEPGKMIGQHFEGVFPEEIFKIIEESSRKNEMIKLTEYKLIGARGEQIFFINCFPVSEESEIKGTILLVGQVEK